MKFKISNLKSDAKESDVRKLEAAVKSVQGVKTVATNLKDASIEITSDPQIKPESLSQAAQKAGFKISAS